MGVSNHYHKLKTSDGNEEMELDSLNVSSNTGTIHQNNIDEENNPLLSSFGTDVSDPKFGIENNSDLSEDDEEDTRLNNTDTDLRNNNPTNAIIQESIFRNNNENSGGGTNDDNDGNNGSNGVNDDENNESSSSEQTLRRSQNNGLVRTRHQSPNTFVHKYVLDNPKISKYIPRFFLAKSKYTGGPIGEGLNNDGVFNNLMAKPDSSSQAHNDETLPSYEEAALDSTPPYWETSVISPGFEDEVFVDGLPVGNLVNFIWNLMVSLSFQFVGFLLTYLLHTSHASKEGSRAGLGLTFMNYGYNMIPYNYYSSGGRDGDKFEPNNPNSIDIDNDKTLEGHLDGFQSDLNNGVVKNTGLNDASAATSGDEGSQPPVFAYGLIALGLFILIKSIIDYHRAKQMEKVILNPPANFTNTTGAETV
ncbi:hypothetical protein PACTADRAFT_52638 [Pachysolen tannophilus NRRL Y-2460]|nr:hypothetical protein PACTADRAFT_52638 [Pachysolen tannophilus NRRL Y-2460]